MASEWYFVDAGITVGPVPLEDIAARIRQARDEKQLVWTAGMQDWADARNVPAFKGLFSTNPPPLPGSVLNSSRPDGETDLDFSDQSVATDGLHPWRRYFARMIDLFVAGLLLAAAFYFVFPSGVISGEAWVSWLIGVFYIPLEALFLTTWGTTFGKYVYGITITPNDGDMTYSTAFRRSLMVWWRGLGTGFPFASLITLIVAYSNLKKNRITSWDRDCDLRISHVHISPLRWAAILAVWSVIVPVCVAGSLID